MTLVLVAACDSGPTAPAAASWSWEYPFVGAPCDVDSPGPSLSRARRDSIPDRGSHRTRDDEWAEISRAAPGGWGGRFVLDRRLTIYLVHPDSAEEAIPALNALGARIGSRPDVLRGRWSFAQLYDWYNYFQLRGIWSIEGVHLSDIDEMDNRLDYGITPEDLPAVASLLSDLGAPCGLVMGDIGPGRFVFGGTTGR